MNHGILLIFPLLMITLPIIVLSLKLFFQGIPLIILGFLFNRGKYAKKDMCLLAHSMRVGVGIILTIWYLLIITGGMIIVAQYILSL
ncbi:hypothetical protein PVA44_04860 [Entomospira nematocerorum]|uniref:Uncharacterized protein n=1 Tax=Entomospira nematocerorum TaxID=2719987 RepID=A0A968GBB3_9SPIO|nr:hypothetical protein [Entomospira nematocera]NIZ46649.1 hypothetical protein [Entomospira nematocera]WDI33553.1 hypothetical protein PVA44_04860 [Entomospira nematocera]